MLSSLLPFVSIFVLIDCFEYILLGILRALQGKKKPLSLSL
jgi:hypothetical protein